MPDDTPTPRTDALLETLAMLPTPEYRALGLIGFARILERELAAKTVPTQVKSEEKP